MLSQLLQHYPFLVLDGAFSTELERRGFSINDALWSAIALYQRPDLVKAVHRSYYEAGADIVESASYQATIPGFVKKGFTHDEAAALLRKTITLAREARDEFLAVHRLANRPRPLVASSIGPYGAYLADGSEYRGHYGKTKKELMDFHRERFHVLAEAGPDLFAFETIPSLIEAEAEAEVLAEIPSARAWISFSCKDGRHTCGEDLLSDCAKALAGHPQIEAIGINCTAPDYVASLIGEIRKVTDLPVVVYPNSGETWDAASKTWTGAPSDYAAYARVWYEAGARLIGGCCRTTPDDIRKVSAFRDSLRGVG